MKANNVNGDTTDDVNLAEVDEYLDNFMKNNEGIACPEKVNTPASNSTSHIDKLCYKLKNARKTKIFRIADGKIECPFCGIFAKNVMLHFQRKEQCGEKLNMDHFLKIHDEYKKENERNKNRIRVQNCKNKKKETNPDAFRKNQNQEQQKKRDKQRASNLEAFKAHHNEEKQQSRDKQRASNPKAFKSGQNEEKQQSGINREHQTWKLLKRIITKKCSNQERNREIILMRK